MGFSSGLTLQMDLIVLRNSIFCHSACAPCPSPEPGCSRRGPYQRHSGCGMEQLSSASDLNYEKEWQRVNGSEKWKEKSGRVQDGFLRGFCGVAYAPLPSHLRLLYAPVHANRRAFHDTGVQYNHTWALALCEMCQKTHWWRSHRGGFYTL